MFLLNYNAKVWIIFRLSKLNDEKYHSIGCFLIYIKSDDWCKVDLLRVCFLNGICLKTARILLFL